jgi:hypothetical protein
MSAVDPFTPGGNFSISVTTTTGRVATTGAGNVMRLANVSSTECFVAFGTGSVNATTSGFSMPGNSQVFVASSDAITHVAAITASGTTTLRISRGDGGV